MVSDTASNRWLSGYVRQHDSRLVFGVRDALVRALSILRKPRKTDLGRNLCFGVPMAPTGALRAIYFLFASSVFRSPPFVGGLDVVFAHG